MQKGQSLRSINFFRPYYLNGAEMNDVFLYNETGILFESSRWLQDATGNDITFIGELDLDSVARRRVEKLDRKEHFTLHRGALGVDLYLYAPALGWNGEEPHDVILRRVEEELVYRKIFLEFTRQPDGEPELVTLVTPVPVERRKTKAGELIKALEDHVTENRICERAYTLAHRITQLSNDEVEDFITAVREAHKAVTERKLELGIK